MSRSRDEPVRLTKIYTRGGDKGETSRGDGKRVPKTDLRIAAYGTVDELNSLLGLALASDDLPEEFRPWLEQVQNDLFDVGADLSVPLTSRHVLAQSFLRTTTSPARGRKPGWRSTNCRPHPCGARDDR